MSKEKKQSKIPKNYNPAEWYAIGMHNKEQNIVYHENSFSLKQPDDYKVYLFGKELTNGKEWNDFLERGLELEQENKELKNRIADLEAKLAEKDEQLDWCQGMMSKLSHPNKERAIYELEKVKEWVDGMIATNIKYFGKNIEPNFDTLTVLLDNQIEELKKEMK